MKNGQLHPSSVYGHLQYFKHLADVPVGRSAIIESSSGYEFKRFTEIVVQGKSAKDHFSQEVVKHIM